MADNGVLEIYDENTYNLKFSLNSRLMNFLGTFWIPRGQATGQIYDPRIRGGDPIAISIWDPSVYGYGQEQYTVYRPEPKFSFEGDYIKWSFPTTYSWKFRNEISAFYCFYGII